MRLPSRLPSRSGWIEEPLDWTLDWLQRKGGRCFNRFGGIHGVLLYETPKVTRIRDAKLGLLYYIMLALVLVYITYQLCNGLEYLDGAAPVMSAHFDFRAPVLPPCTDPITDTGCLWNFKHFDKLDYCCNDQRCVPHPTDKEACHCEGLAGKGIVNTTEKEGNEPSQSEEKAVTRSDADKVRSYRCRVFDSLRAADNWGETIFVKTYVESWQETRNPDCNLATGNCDVVWKNRAGPGVSFRRFVGDIEDYTLTIYHTVGVNQYGISESAGTMKGFLKVGPAFDGVEPSPRQHKLCRSRDDAVTQPWRGEPTDKAPCFIKPQWTKDGDKFELSLLLDAMNISLNDVGMESDMSLRRHGFNMDIDVIYLNSWPWEGLLGEVVYYYELFPRVKAKYEGRQYFPLNRKSMAVRERALETSKGILINISAGGKLMIFSVQRLFVTLTTALALMTMATFLVNLVARFLLRWGSYYSLLMYDTSGDFGRLREISNMTDSELAESLIEKGQPTGGTREERILLLLETEDHAQTDALADAEGGMTPPKQRGSTASNAMELNAADELRERRTDVDADADSENTPLMRMGTDPRTGSSSGTSYGARFSASR